MNRSQILAVAGAITILLLLFFFAETRDPSIPDAEITGEVNHSTSDHQDRPDFTLDDYKARVSEDLAPATVNAIAYWEDELRSLDDSVKLAAIDSLLHIYSRENLAVLRAYHFMDRAELTGSLADWSLAGDLHLQLLVLPDLPQDIKVYFYQNAVSSYNEVLALEPDQVNAKLKLAKAHVSMDGMEVMNGVQLLLGILEDNPENLDAYLLLAENGLRSGQFEKAAGRIHSAMEIEPRFAGQVYGLAEVGSILSEVMYDQGSTVSSDSLLSSMYDYAVYYSAQTPKDSVKDGLNQMVVTIARSYLKREDQSVMNGVQMLLAEAEKNPGNLPVQLELIRQAIRSEQYEKAGSRLEIVVSLPTSNRDAYYLEIADLLLQVVDYRFSQGNEDESVRLLELLKGISGEAEKETLNEAINEIKNKKE